LAKSLKRGSVVVFGAMHAHIVSPIEVNQTIVEYRAKIKEKTASFISELEKWLILLRALKKKHLIR